MSQYFIQAENEKFQLRALEDEALLTRCLHFIESNYFAHSNQDTVQLLADLRGRLEINSNFGGLE